MISRLICVGLLAVAPLACAEQPASKTELAAKVVKLQQAGVDSVARGLAEQPLTQMLQAAVHAVQTQVSVDRREAATKAIDAEARKYLDEVMPLLRERATTLAPGVLGPLLEEKFSEDELRQLITWLQSPVYKKFHEVAPTMQKALAQKVVSDTRVAVEPKLKALEAASPSRSASRRKPSQQARRHLRHPHNPKPSPEMRSRWAAATGMRKFAARHD